MNEAFALANMKRQLRCREADVCNVHEAKHTLTSPCAEGTLHRRSRLHFSYTLECASFAPKSLGHSTPIQLDKLEFTYLNLSLNRPSDQHQYRIIYNHIPRLTDLQRILLFHYPEHIILQIIIFSFSYNYTPSLNSYLSVR